jgi:hypothetical protein
LPELFGGAEREPLQAKLPAVRLLFELLGFLLSKSLTLTARAISVYND